MLFLTLASVAAARSEPAATRSDDPVAWYNAGVASYRDNDYKTAKGSFTQALITEDKALEAKTQYNIGNALFKMAKESEATDPDQASDALKQAAHYYQKAIERDPGDIDAKYNHELSGKLLKIIQARPKTQQQQQKNQQDQDKNKGQQEQIKGGQGQEEQDKQDQQQEERNKGQEKANGQQNSQQEKKNGSERKEHEGKISEEEARMLASQFGQENIRLDLNRGQNNKERAVLKDW